MPRQNQFFDNLSETPLLNEPDAINVLYEYCDEYNIDLGLIPSEAIDNFIDTIRYAPHQISTSEIANRTGVVRRQEIPYITFNTAQSRPQRVQAISSGESNIPIQQPPRPPYNSYAEYARQVHDELLTAYDVSDTMVVDTADTAIHHIVASAGTGRSINDYFSMDDLPFSYSSSPTPKKKKRSDYDMMMEIVRSEKFPRPNFKDWQNSRELENILNDWYSNVEYREQWIFSRREREGFNRRNIGHFSLDDVMARMDKRKKPHELDSSFSKFYDWKLGGTDWILRLELFQHEQAYFLIIRHVHKPTESEIKFDVRYWKNDQFKSLNTVWCQRSNENAFERVFGSHDESNPYYVKPYEGDEDLDLDIEDDYYDDYEEDNEDGDW